MKNNNNIEAGIIFESFTPIVYKRDLMLLEESENNGVPKVKFKMRLQTLEEKNGNGRATLM